MRILQIANAVRPGQGGYLTMQQALAHGYRTAGHEVIRLLPGSADRRSHDADAEVVTLRASRLRRTDHRIVLDHGRVLGVLDDLRPDRIEVSGRCVHQAVGRWAQSQGVPTVAIVNERLDAILARYVRAPRLAGRLADVVNLRPAVSFDTIVCSSSWVAREITRVGAPNVVTVPPGVDLTAFHPGHASPQLRRELAGDDQPLIVVAGDLAPPARPDLAIGAVRHLGGAGSPAHLVLAGTGRPSRAGQRPAVTGVPVTFMGLRDARHRAQLLATADLVLAPGPTYDLAVIALEALACGTPVVAQRDGVAADLLSTGAGVVAAGAISDANAASFAAAARRVLAVDPQRRRATSRARAKRFAWPEAVARMLRAHRLGVAAPRLRRSADVGVDVVDVELGDRRPRLQA